MLILKPYCLIFICFDTTYKLTKERKVSDYPPCMYHTCRIENRVTLLTTRQEAQGLHWRLVALLFRGPFGAGAIREVEETLFKGGGGGGD